MLRIFICFIFSLILSSCSGYHFVTNENPFKELGISSISIPVFVNDTLYPGISSSITRKIVNVLEGYNDLSVVPGLNRQSDAVLLGIVKGKKKRVEAFDVTASKLSSTFDGSLENRREMLLPSTVDISGSVTFILILRPSSSIFKQISENKDIFENLLENENIVWEKSVNFTKTLTYSFSVKSDSSDGSSPVNSVRNRGTLYNSYDEIGSSVANEFRNVVLNVF